MEQQILLEIQKVSAGQDNLKGQVRDLRMSLMGSGDDGETEHGRLPMAESEIKELREYIKTLEARVKVLEDAHVRYGVYGRFITAGSAFAAGLIGYFVEAVAHSIFGSSKQ
jgi:hypothetical protein